VTSSRSISISRLAYTLLKRAKLGQKLFDVHLARWTEIIRTERFYARCAPVTWFYVWRLQMLKT